jgi:ribonucleoside-diphosphate reductase alpha chain
VSKTCNVTGEMPWGEFKDIYRRAWDGGAKGCTTFNIDGQRMALLKKGESGEGSSCTIDPNTGARSCE